MIFRADHRLPFISAAAFLLALLLMTGCFSRREKAPPAFIARPAGGQTNLVIAPARSAVGHVASVNDQAKIVVVDFPIGQVPPDGTRLSVFRAGQKVGEVKMSEWTADNLRVGDILAGAVQKDDEVRAE